MFGKCLVDFLVMSKGCLVDSLGHWMISRGCLFVDAFRVSYEITLGSLLDASWAPGGCLLSSCRFLGLRSDVL